MSTPNIVDQLGGLDPSKNIINGCIKYANSIVRKKYGKNFDPEKYLTDDEYKVSNDITRKKGSDPFFPMLMVT